MSERFMYRPYHDYMTAAMHMYCTWIEHGMGDMTRLRGYLNLTRFVERARRHSPAIRAMLVHHLAG